MTALYTSSMLMTPPAIEPVSLDEIKAQARISSDEENALLERLARAARQWCERTTGRVFIEQVWSVALSSVPRGRSFELPCGPVLGVEAIEAYDDRDNATLWGADLYYVDLMRVPARIVLRDGACWPDMMRCANGLRVTYRAGYGGAASDVPDLIRTAILQLTTHWYEHRGEAAAYDERTLMVPLTVQALLQPFKIIKAGG